MHKAVEIDTKDLTFLTVSTALLLTFKNLIAIKDLPESVVVALYFMLPLPLPSRTSLGFLVTLL
jgi:hypothetical protein